MFKKRIDDLAKDKNLKLVSIICATIVFVFFSYHLFFSKYAVCMSGYKEMVSKEVFKSNKGAYKVQCTTHFYNN